MVADSRTGKVDSRFDPGKARQIYRAGDRVPFHFIGTGGWFPNESQHFMARSAQVRDQRGPDQSMGSGDRYPHRAVTIRDRPRTRLPQDVP